MIQFQKIRWRNLLSTGNNFTEVDLDKHQKVLIVGQNGSGKSTILDAISFGLFGKPHRNINKPALMNSINNKDCLVEITFTIGPKSYLVRRGLKPNIFEIHVDGKLLNQSSHSKEYQKILEQNILKLNYKSFHQIVVLGSSSFIPFMQLSAMNRREVIESLLDIDIFSKMNILVKERHQKLKNDIQELKHLIELNDTRIKSKSDEIQSIQDINRQQTEKLADRLAEINKEINRLYEENQTINKKLDILYPKFKRLLTNLKNEISQLKTQQTELSTEVKNLQESITLFSEHDICPTCEQDIDAELKRDTLNKSETKRDELTIELDKIIDQIDEYYTKRNDCESEINVLDSLRNDKRTNERLILNHENEKTRLNQNSENNRTENLQKLKSEQETFKNNKLIMVNKKEQMLEQYEYNVAIIDLLKDGGIKTKIIKQYLPIINQLINEYLQVLDFYVRFELDETFSETIKSRHRDNFTYDSFSEGEKSRIDLSLLFAWRQIAKMKNSISTNLLIMDEVLDSSLDVDGIDNLNKILHTLEEDNNLFIISHRDISDAFFDAKIEFKKPRNFSQHTLEVL